jgi:hypothetical protein
VRVRASYLAEVEKFISQIKRACTRMLADYVLVNTRQPIETVIAGYLTQRTQAGKLRRT